MEYVAWTLALFAWRWNRAVKTIAIPWSRQTSHLAPSPMKTLRQNWSVCIQCRTMAMAAALVPKHFKENLSIFQIQGHIVNISTLVQKMADHDLCITSIPFPSSCLPIQK